MRELELKIRTEAKCFLMIELLRVYPYYDQVQKMKKLIVFIVRVLTASISIIRVTPYFLNSRDN